MITEIGSRLRITNPSPDMVDWCKKHLEIPNPEYQKKARMNLWLGDTPRTLVMYEVDGDSVIIPFGCLRSILPLLEGDVKKLFTKQVKVDYKGAKVPLYDYQEEAVGAMIINHYGILQSPAGSGKTQIGIALACSMRLKTLWLTHTKDLLTQSKNRAAQYIDKSLLGTITEGKVNIGETMTFATIQTMCKVDLNQYRDTWDCIIVDECHRVAGTPTAVTQFSKVLNTLRARHKYGLSATVHRADGLIKATYAMLGHVIYTVPDEAVKSRVMMVDVQPKGTGVKLDSAFLNSDGTINYCKMITYLTTHTDRNQIKAMYMTNAKLTSVYLQAEKPEKPWTDERNYRYPDKLLRQYIPQEIFDFFDRLHDPNVPDIDLFGGYDQYGRKIKGASIEFRIGDCVCTIAYGGIHGAIPNYVEVATENRSIRNKDVGSYYPHLMTIPLSAGQQYGFCSRNIPSPQIFVDMLEERMKAKKAGDKKTANALKLVANTSYGAMLNGKNGISYNDLYDPLMGRSVCITGQLLLLELSMHLVAECPTLKIIQLNTDACQ